MANWYLGVGGSDSNDGSTWALRKLTLSGADSITYTNGDILYVGPGEYAAGDFAAGASINIVGDTTGENTDGIGGPVIFSHNNATTTTMAFTISSGDTIELHRLIFLGHYGILTVTNVSNTGSLNAYNCAFIGNTNLELLVQNTDTVPYYVDKCLFLCTDSSGGAGIRVVDAGVQTTPDEVVISSCFFYGNRYAQYGVIVEQVNWVYIIHNTFEGLEVGIQDNALAGHTYPTFVNGNLFKYCTTGIAESFSGAVDLNENAYSECGTNESVNATETFLDTFVQQARIPMPEYNKNQEKAVLNILNVHPFHSMSGRNVTWNYAPPTDDFFGLPRNPETAHRCYGAFTNSEQNVTEERGFSGTSSLEFPMGVGVQQFRVPVKPSQQITVSVRVYRESGYTGTNPSMVISEVGQTDRTTTDTGSVTTWNLLTDTFTPGASTNYILITLKAVSNDPSTTSEAVFFDNLQVG